MIQRAKTDRADAPRFGSVSAPAPIRRNPASALPLTLLLFLVLPVACGETSQPVRDTGGAPGAAPAPSSPAEPRTGTVPAADGVPIAYTVRGQGSPALVFIHCWSCDQGFWHNQVDEFAHDHQVVTLDLPGHGLSGTNRKEWTLETYGDDVRTVVDHLGLEHIVLIGHSMGGPVVLEAAARLPGRVDMVVPVDTLQDIGKPMDPKEVEQFIRPFEQDFTGHCQEFVASLFPKGAAADLVAGVKQSMCDADPAIALALLRMFPAYDQPRATEALTCPIRAIQGSSFPTNVEGNRRHAKDYDAVIIPGTGHFPHLEKPEEFNRVLRQVLTTLS